MGAQFYAPEVFYDCSVFLARAWSRQAYPNLNRRNSYQGWRTPVGRLRQAAPLLSGRGCLLPPVDLVNLLPMLPDRGQQSRPQETIHHLTEPSPNPPPRVHIGPDIPLKNTPVLDSLAVYG